MIGLLTNTALGQTFGPKVDSIKIKPIPGDDINKTVSLNVSNTDLDSSIVIEGSHNLNDWHVIDQIDVKQGLIKWEKKHPISLQSYFFRVKNNYQFEVYFKELNYS